MSETRPAPGAPEGEGREPDVLGIIDGALSNFIDYCREDAGETFDPQYDVDARHIRDDLRKGNLHVVADRAVARVLALCDEADEDGPHTDLNMDPYLMVSDVRAALGGTP